MTDVEQIESGKQRGEESAGRYRLCRWRSLLPVQPCPVIHRPPSSARSMRKMRPRGWRAACRQEPAQPLDIFGDAALEIGIAGRPAELFLRMCDRYPAADSQLLAIIIRPCIGDLDNGA